MQFFCRSILTTRHHDETSEGRKFRGRFGIKLWQCVPQASLSLCARGSSKFTRRRTNASVSLMRNMVSHTRGSRYRRAKRSQADGLLSASHGFLTSFVESALCIFHLSFSPLPLQIQPCQRNSLRRTNLSFFAKRNNNFDQPFLNSSVHTISTQNKIPTLYVLLQIHQQYGFRFHHDNGP